MVINPGKHPRGKHRYQDKCWKLHVHDYAQSFLLCSYTLHELCNQISIGLLVSIEQATIVFCLCTVKAKKRPKTDNKVICLVLQPFPSISYGQRVSNLKSGEKNYLNNKQY